MNRLVAIVGPTGTGKSRLALRLAQAFHGEIVSADSRQICRHMDIGVAKPTTVELSLVPHHLIDIINPDEDFSLAQYQQLAYAAIKDIQQRQRLAILVGGSGLYVWSVVEGWRIPPVAPALEYRQDLEKRAAGVGREELYRELERVDSSAAEKIGRHNVRRIIRALEVYYSSGTPFSRLQKKETPAFNTLIIGLTTERKELYRRIDARIDLMVEQGLVEEIKRLVDMGYHLDLPAMSSIGYRQIGLFLRGETTREEAVRHVKFATNRLIRHQYNWFQLTDKRIQWFDIRKDIDAEVINLVAEFIGAE